MKTEKKPQLPPGMPAPLRPVVMGQARQLLALVFDNRIAELQEMYTAELDHKPSDAEIETIKARAIAQANSEKSLLLNRASEMSARLIKEMVAKRRHRILLRWLVVIAIIAALAIGLFYARKSYAAEDCTAFCQGAKQREKDEKQSEKETTKAAQKEDKTTQKTEKNASKKASSIDEQDQELLL